MEKSLQDLESNIGARVRTIRLEQNLTLDELALQSGVSRAMISRIERGEASPTAQLLARLCSALGTTLSRFFAFQDAPASPLSRHADQHLWRDPETGYVRRAVSPEGMPTPVDIVAVDFPPGARVVFDPHPPDAETTQHVWLFEGRLTMTSAGEVHALEPGDCLFMPLGHGHSFHNPHSELARYAVILNRRILKTR
ncbi:XRE family transcriptional regulator [Rhizobium sp. 32-5/1]|uniref:helix-turn-helix domain-containing protein n=1 Tax=Rhizobium sp. 32-5/1 TaxID=3019602 RepID=UPI00240E5619|nr:XRE family transcriptional regulator [Rhizobium sp. 32-5/1]WEZ84961.1 XRE family transcriptional regulator [Rhizobium sp. 32-5/1]